MSADHERRRALIAAEKSLSDPLVKLFGTGPLQVWQARAVDGLRAARTLLQGQPFDALIIDETAYRKSGPIDRVWLEGQKEAGVLLVARAQAALVAHALGHGVGHWLPRFLVRHHPLVLAAALDRTAQLSDLRRRTRQVGTALQESRRQVDRLAGLLWRTLPSDGQVRWLTQRGMMERLQEEVSRAERYGHSLTVVLGEVESPTAGATEPFGSWVADHLSRAKRRCDVAGQYGPRGFMLLLPHTPETGGVVCCRRLHKLLQAQRLGEPGREAGRTYFGLAGFSPAAPTAAALLSLAEQSLAAARAGDGLLAG
jgi:GGDEF domain-containing protein